MAIFYLDYVNGNDANDGSSWALAWKTITSGATAARIAAGDIIRIAKSPDPTSLGINATWTDLSKTVALASALNLTVDLCETAWTASANVTATASTARKEGSYSASLAIAAGFTTGKAAYKALGASTDFSTYQQLSFWIQNNAAIASGNVLRICLCSDTTGDTIVDSFYIPAIPSTGQWVAFTIDKAAALGGAIQSVALYADSDPGTITLLIDDIIACKASSSADSLSLTSKISKNSAASGGDEGWWGIQSINGTTVLLDAHVNNAADTGRGYSGTTETVATYKREIIKTDMVSASGTVVQEIQDSGTIGNLITFSGGWNTATTVQDGETFFDSQNGNGIGLRINSIVYIRIERLSFIKYYEGVRTQSCYNCDFNFFNLNNNSYAGLNMNYGDRHNSYTIKNLLSNNSYGFFESALNNDIVITNILSTAGSGRGLGVNGGNRISIVRVANNQGYGLFFSESTSGAIIKNAIVKDNNSGSVAYFAWGGYSNFLFNCQLNDTVECSVQRDWGNGRLYSYKHDQTADNHQIFTDSGLISSEATVRHTASGISWKLSPTNAIRSANYPLDFKIAKFAVTANNLVTVKAWLRRSNTGLTGMLVCRGGQLAGVASDVTASMTAAANTWEELTITFTPTEAGVIEIETWAYGGTTYSLYVDDMTISQA